MRNTSPLFFILEFTRKLYNPPFRCCLPSSLWLSLCSISPTAQLIFHLISSADLISLRFYPLSIICYCFLSVSLLLSAFTVAVPLPSLVLSISAKPTPPFHLHLRKGSFCHFLRFHFCLPSLVPLSTAPHTNELGFSPFSQVNIRTIHSLHLFRRRSPSVCANFSRSQDFFLCSVRLHLVFLSLFTSVLWCCNHII
ncbi:hypothetical protein FB446DRAFT_96709 [Lentinula raphanica]|nr:hypothetical protein FB446DRAFT_96709 [Lentinula raphanica]